MRSSVAVADMDQDGQPEIFVGNFGGGLQLFNADIPIHNLGLSEMKDGYHLEIFPNPVSSQLHIISKDDDIKKVIITDIYGRKCLQQPAGAREVVLEVSSLAGGVYLMVLELERGLVNRIFLKR